MSHRLGFLAAAALLMSSACGSGGADGGHAAAARTNLAQLAERTQNARDRPLLLVFWATWCEPCVAEIPDLVTFHANHPGAIEIVAVSLDGFLYGGDTAQGKVDAFLASTSVPYENVVFDGSQDELFAHFSLPGGIPYAILFDAHGTVRERFPGRVDLAKLQQALAEPAGS